MWVLERTKGRENKFGEQSAAYQIISKLTFVQVNVLPYLAPGKSSGPYDIEPAYHSANG